MKHSFYMVKETMQKIQVIDQLVVSIQKTNKAGKERQYGGTLLERVRDIPSEGISTKT